MSVSQYNYATSLLEKKNFKKAISEYKKLLKVMPCKEGYLNLGNCYRNLRDEETAVEYFTLAADPEVPYLNGERGKYTLALNNIGLNRYSLGQNSAAIDLYREAIALDDNYIDAKWNLSSALLKEACSRESDLEKEGLDLYESRFAKKPPVALHVDIPGLKYWDGRKVRKLVILAEQGLGDQFMWARYLGLAATMCEELWVQADNSLAPVFALAGIRTCFKISEVGEITDSDAGLPMCSLSRAFGIIPDNSNWLEGKVEKRVLGSGFNIGIAWAGSPTHANDHNRSVSLGYFNKLASIGNLYALKPGFTSTKYVTGLDINSWIDTLEYMNSMDLIITVDTSIAHAAGSLGIKTWMLQPLRETDFRWGKNSMGKDNVWYPCMDIYRNKNDWFDVFERVEKDLREVSKCRGLCA